MRIIALSGKKQAGKNTTANYIAGRELVRHGAIANFSITEEGKLFTQLNENDIVELNLSDPFDQARQLWPIVKIYAFGDLLKNVTMALFGLTHEQVYGTDEQKNTLTEVRWENIPLYTRNEVVGGFSGIMKTARKSGQMTAREVLQIFGSEVCRKMHNNVWVDALIRQIQAEQPSLAIITDTRFPNEVKGVEDAGGIVLRLTRNIYNDRHVSEVSLDKHPFQHVIDNHSIGIVEQNNLVESLLNELEVQELVTQ